MPTRKKAAKSKAASKKTTKKKATTQKSGKSRQSATKAGSSRDANKPSDKTTLRSNDVLAEQGLAANDLVAGTPFNAEKKREHGHDNAIAPPEGSTVAPADERLTASTETEASSTAKTGGAALSGRNATIDTLDRVRADGGGQALTTNQGVAVADNQNSLKAGLRGPALLEDFILREKVTHFDHERIPERIVHARGSGAHGHFEAYEALTRYTRAAPFSEAGKVTPTRQTDVSSTAAVIPRIVAGVGRSGTTWVQDALAQANSMRAVFEPLHPQNVQGADAFAHRCLFSNDAERELHDFLSPFLRGEFHSLWADYRIESSRVRPRLRDFASPRQFKRYLRACSTAYRRISRYRGQRRYRLRITKFIRANMMLGWIKKNFDAKIVFIVRHPAAVILSQMNAPHAWNPQSNIARYRRDIQLMEMLDDNTSKLLGRNLADVEALALSWCIENGVALRQCRESGIPVVYYETLVDRGYPEWQRITAALALHVVPDQRLIAQPSQQAWGDKAKSPRLVRQYASWMKRIDKPTATTIQDTLNATGIRFYSIDQATPITSASDSAALRGGGRVGNVTGITFRG